MNLTKLGFQKVAFGPHQELQFPTPDVISPQAHLLTGGYTAPKVIQSDKLYRNNIKNSPGIPNAVKKKIFTKGLMLKPNTEAYIEQIKTTPTLPDSFKAPMIKAIGTVNSRNIKRHETVHYLRRKQVGDMMTNPSTLKALAGNIKEEAIAYYHQRPKATKLRRAADVVVGTPFSVAKNMANRGRLMSAIKASSKLI